MLESWVYNMHKSYRRKSYHDMFYMLSVGPRYVSLYWQDPTVRATNGAKKNRQLNPMETGTACGWI